ncbi:hypothetical protein SUGI_0972400 [Cryptomeria japonica]|nr:hypothetical protein SUGI_0972400 [Cryptomeria japonica]
MLLGQPQHGEFIYSYSVAVNGISVKSLERVSRKRNLDSWNSSSNRIRRERGGGVLPKGPDIHHQEPPIANSKVLSSRLEEERSRSRSLNISARNEEAINEHDDELGKANNGNSDMPSPEGAPP